MRQPLTSASTETSKDYFNDEISSSIEIFPPFFSSETRVTGEFSTSAVAAAQIEVTGLPMVSYAG